MNSIFSIFKSSFLEFKNAPVKYLIVTLLFLLGSATCILTGVSVIAYLWFLSRSTQNQQHPFSPFQNTQYKPLLDTLSFSSRLAGRNRLTSLTTLGLFVWSLFIIRAFGFEARLFGTPLFWYFCQPLFLVMMIADAYDLNLKIAIRTAILFVRHSPASAFVIIALNFLTYAGSWLALLPFAFAEYFSLLFLVTLPLFLRTSLLYMQQCSKSLHSAIQKAYE